MKNWDKEKDETAVSTIQPEKVFYDNRIKRKNVLALNEKVAAIREYEKMPVYKRIGRMFHCSPDQIKRIVQQKESILKAWEQRTRRSQDAKTLQLKVVRVSMLGKAVYEWIRRMMYYKDFMITDGLIQKMALQFKSAMGLQNFFPHPDWCDKFRQTYKITANDSKQLNIGYTQGYSVQIKDVMKDVLSECTPDSEALTNDHRLDEENQNENEADDDATDDNEGNEDNNNDNSYNNDRKDIKMAGENLTIISSQHQHQQQQQQQQHHHHHQQQQQQQQRLMSGPQISARPLPQLQPIRQLVALPIKTNALVSGMSQKVLVATPITPSSCQRTGNGNIAGGSGGGAGVNVSATPMTMTIIPFTTIAQTQPNSTQMSVVEAATGSTANVTLPKNISIHHDRPLVPSPIIEIKKEIKKEPLDEVYIKQEYISDDDDDDDNEDAQTVGMEQKHQHHHQHQHTLTMTPKTIIPMTTIATPTTSTAPELPEGAAVKVNLPSIRKNLSDDASLIDDDNMALASLRQLIRKPNQKVTNGNMNSIVTRPARTKQMSLRNLINETPQTAAAAAGGVSSSSSSSPSSSAAGSTIATAIVTSTSTSNTTQSSTSTFSRSSTQIHPTRQLASKRKQRSNDASSMPPIKSCSEARRYLKLLEDFALHKENFRLIGLITRADEVLRELDGDDDVDID